MNPKLQIADFNNKEAINQMLKVYFKELNNSHEYQYLDKYWEEENRNPFLIKVKDNVVGFVLVNLKDPQSIPNYPQGIAEFYVKKEFRNKGIGKDIAVQIFDMFPGKWTIRETDENINGQSFWRKVIQDYTKGNFQEIYLNNRTWKGPIQLFDNTK